MMTDYIGPNGERFSTDTIRARVSRDAQEAADRIIAQHGTEQVKLQNLSNDEEEVS